MGIEHCYVEETTEEIIVRRTLEQLHCLVGRYEQGMIDEETYTVAINALSRISINIDPELDLLIEEACEIDEEPMTERHAVVLRKEGKQEYLAIVKWTPGERDLEYIMARDVELDRVEKQRVTHTTALEAKRAFLRIKSANRNELYNRQETI